MISTAKPGNPPASNKSLITVSQPSSVLYAAKCTRFHPLLVVTSNRAPDLSSNPSVPGELSETQTIIGLLPALFCLSVSDLAPISSWATRSVPQLHERCSGVFPSPSDAQIGARCSIKSVTVFKLGASLIVAAICSAVRPRLSFACSSSIS